MADEAVLRIVMQDDGSAAAPRSAPTPNPSSPSQPSQPAQPVPAGTSQPPSQRQQRPPQAAQPFDPQEEVEKRRERERRRAQVNDTYREQYSDRDGNKGADSLLSVIDSLRGTIGGVFGPVAGAVVDLVSAFHKMGVADAEDRYEQELLAEVRATTAAVHGVRDAVNAASKPPPPPSETKPSTVDEQFPEVSAPLLELAIPGAGRQGMPRPAPTVEPLVPGTGRRGTGPAHALSEFESVLPANIPEAVPVTKPTQAPFNARLGLAPTAKPIQLPFAQPPITGRQDAGPMQFESVLPADIPAALPVEPGPRAIPTTPSMLSRGINIPEAKVVNPPEAKPANLPYAKPPLAQADIPEALPAETGAAEGMAGAAGAVGAVGAIVMAAKVVNDAVVGSIRSTISTMGDVMRGIASPNNDPSVPIGALGDAASKAGEKVSMFVPTVGFMGVAAGEAAKSLSSLMQALDQTANKYGEYSPEIAQAQAIAEVNTTLGDMRRAQEVGPELARYVQVQGELQNKFEDIKIKLLVKILPAVTRILEIIEMATSAGEGIEKAVSALTQPLSSLASAAAEMVGMQQDDRAPDISDPTDAILGGPERIPVRQL